jgi:hypothetical protein
MLLAMRYRVQWDLQAIGQNLDGWRASKSGGS